MAEPNASKPTSASPERPTTPTKNGCFRAVVVVAALVLLVLTFPFCAFVVAFGSIAPGLRILCLLVGEAGALAFVLRWATRRRWFGWIGATLLLGAIATTSGHALWRWWTHDRFETVPETGSVQWWRYQPFKEDNLLPRCDAPEEFRFRDGVPRLCAAYALYPIEAAAVQALATPESYAALPQPNSHVSFAGSDMLFDQLAEDPPWKCDAVFGLKPSPEQEERAKELGLDLRFTPVARDAFVFFVHADNPATNLTTGQIRAIYSGRAKTWRDAGVSFDARLMPFQRNKNSGSQTALERLMDGEPILPPIEEDRLGGMGAIFRDVADYRNRRGAIGFSFRYYATELVAAGKIRLLSIDGIAPTVENIRSGAYPFLEDAYLVTDGAPTGDVARLAAFLVSPSGRQLVEDVGYVAPVTQNPSSSLLPSTVIDGIADFHWPQPINRQAKSNSLANTLLWVFRSARTLPTEARAKIWWCPFSARQAVRKW